MFRFFNINHQKFFAWAWIILSILVCSGVIVKEYYQHKKINLAAMVGCVILAERHVQADNKSSLPMAAAVLKAQEIIEEFNETEKSRWIDEMHQKCPAQIEKIKDMVLERM